MSAVCSTGLALTGWVANQIEPALDLFEENVDTLKARIDAPPLGVVAHADRELTPASVAEHLDVNALLTVTERVGDKSV